MVLSHYHALSCFVLGQGLTEDSQRVLEQIQLQKKNSQVNQQQHQSGAETPKRTATNFDSIVVRALK